MKCKLKPITFNRNCFCASINLGLQIKPQVDAIFNLMWMNTWDLQSVQWAVLLSWCQSCSWSIIRYVFITNFHHSEWVQSDFRFRFMWTLNFVIRFKYSFISHVFWTNLQRMSCALSPRLVLEKATTIMSADDISLKKADINVRRDFLANIH